MNQINIEIKARCNNHEAVRDYLIKHGADFKGVDHQIDTYYKVPKGRLKLRMGNIENTLIHYERTNQTGPKQSDVVLYDTAPDSSLKNVLAKALDVLVVVDKEREIYFIDNIKFHIDTVKGLGTFMEIEAIDRTGARSREFLQGQCEQHMKSMGIFKNDLVPNSYSDMLLLLQPSKSSYNEVGPTIEGI